MVISQERRKAIRTFYRVRRVAIDKTQQEVADRAGLELTRYFRIEHGRFFPTAEERPRLARVLRVEESELPTERASEAVAS